MADPVYQFGDFRLDAGRFELLRNGHCVRLERKPLDLLILLASSQGRQVTRTEIAERLWDKEVFVDTEHGINTAIRKIRAVLRDDPEDPRFIQTVTAMGYRFIAPTGMVEAHPPASALVASSTASTVAVPAVPENPPATHVAESVDLRSRRVWIALGGGFILALAVLAALTIGPHSLAGRFAHEKASAPIRSIAVLPLANFSGNRDQDYFADGMTDELITMLAKDSTLRVTSRTSVMQYKATYRPLKEIARALNVDGILEGSVSRSDQRVHMTLQLIGADTDTHLWAESYDRDIKDVAALPNEAARAVAARLNSSSSLYAPVRYVSPEAHDAYLRGLYFWTVGRNEQAGKYFEEAVRLQPDYALGWTGVSRYYGAGAYDGELDPSALPKSIAAAQRAVQLDDTLPQAHSVLAMAIYIGEWDGEHALQEISRATELDPRYAEAFHLHALILCGMGRYDEAIAVQRQGTAIDPIWHPAAMAEILLFARQYDLALADARMRLQDFPQANDLLGTLAEIYHWKGMDKDSSEMLARFHFQTDGLPNQAILNAFRSDGYRGVVRWRLAELERIGKTGYASPVELAELHAELGERERTMALLNEGFRIHDPELVHLGTDPAYDPFRTDPRFRWLIQRVGLTSPSHIPS